ncbi:RAD protein [Plasmodium gonderi]|uniref:RAD protein n=1 Tax=Plasmodium gonderi TaxID=77519 RepID=A0A1Y1JA90_PLAGO|nr:RAD protein [Plasmodium gonderi]GAW79416.1 RAD protein [Plasmodium gonderi]
MHDSIPLCAPCACFVMLLSIHTSVSPCVLHSSVPAYAFVEQKNVGPHSEINPLCNLRILTEMNPSNNLKEQGSEMEQIKTRNNREIPQSVTKKNISHGVPKKRLGSYKTNNLSFKNQMDRPNGKTIQLGNKESECYKEEISEKSIKLTEEEVITILDNLNDIVKKKEMYTLWFNVHNHNVRKYYAMMESLWTDAVNLASHRNITPSDLLKHWWAVYANLIYELRNMDKLCINKFYELFDKGECISNVYKSFINTTKKMWTDSMNSMKHKWNNILYDILSNSPNLDYKSAISQL